MQAKGPGGPAPRLRILVVEDDTLISLVVEDDLRGAGFDVEAFSAPGPALAWLVEHRPDAAILDVSLGDETCLEVAVHLQERGVPFLLATARREEEGLLPGIDNAFWLQKPFSPDSLLDALTAMLVAHKPGL